jgi:hypothetical protein
MANESTIASRSLLPTYESLYGEEGKFPVDPDTVARLRREAEEQGLIFRGDATAGEKLSEFIRNAPDAAYSFLARGAEGTAELAAGLALLTYKGGRLATETDPEKLKEIMAEPSFTKYMGEFRGALGDLNLGENRISGPRLEDITGTIGYYAAPVPVVPVAKGAGQIAKGLASTQVGKNIVDELATTARFFPEYNPLRKFQPKSVGAMSIDELIESGQIKKGTDLTQDQGNLLPIKSTRADKIRDVRIQRGSSTQFGKGKVIEVGEEGTEGTFRHEGKTFNKSDGVLVQYKTGKKWVPKEVHGKGTTRISENKITTEIKKILNENFTNDELLNMRNKEIVEFLEGKGIDFSYTKTPTITVGQIRKGMTGKTTEGKGAVPKPESEKVIRKIGSSLLDEFDLAGQNAINNFTDDIFNLTGFSKTSNDAMRVNSPIKRYLNNALTAVKNGKATKQEIIEQLNKVDKEKFAEVLKKYFNLRDRLKKANELGVDLDDLNLSHMENIADNWKTALDANNLFVATKKANQIIQRKLDKDISNIFEKFRNAKTISEKKELVKEFKNIKKELVDNNLVSIIDGKKIGADIDFEKSFEKFSTSTNDALNERLFRKDGGMVSIFEMIRPINAQR